MAEPLTRQRWRQIAIAGYTPTLVSSLGFGAIMPLIPLQALALGTSKGEAALIVGLYALGALAFSLPAGVIAGKFGDRRAMIFANLAEAAVIALVFFFPSIPMLATAVTVCGAAQGVFMLARQSYMIGAVPAHARGRALSTLGGTHRIGYFLGPLAGAAIVANFGLTVAFGWAALLTLASALIVYLVRDGELPAQRAGTTKVKLLPVLRTHRRVYLTIAVGTGLLTMIRQSRQAIVPLWCANAGLSPAATSLIVAASMACDVALFFPGGYLIDRLGRWWMCVPTLLIMSTGLALLPFAHSLWPIAAVAMLLGVGNGLSSGIVMTLSADHAPEVGRPQFLAGFRFLSDVGASCGPLLISAIATLASLSVAGFATAGIGFFAAWWLTRFVPRSRPPVSPSASGQ